MAILDHKDFSKGDYWVLSADITALYPFMVLSTCLESMKWFLDKFGPNLSNKAKEFLIILTKFMVMESFIIFEGIIYRQIIGAAIGVMWSVVCGNIYLLFL